MFTAAMRNSGQSDSDLPQFPVGEIMKIAKFLVIAFAAAAITYAQDPAFDPNANLKTGPEIGQNIPAFSAVDQNGQVRNFDSLKGSKGLVLFFNRSVDW
jgi:hypothetical protein